MKTTLLAPVLLATTAAAQLPTQVIPQGFDNTEGGSSHWVPGRYAPSRSQTIYDASVLTHLSSMPILSIGWRPDGKRSSPHVAHAFTTTIRMGSVGAKSPNAVDRKSFSANQSSDWAKVLDQKTVQYPALTPSGTGPESFLSIALDRPFVYVAGNPLIIDIESSSPQGQETHYWYADAEYYSTPSSGGKFTKFGTGCPSGRTFVGSVGGPGDSAYYYYYSNGGFGTPAMATLGFSKTQWGPLTLPLALDALGAPGCSLYTDIAASVTGLTDASGTNGRFRVDFTVPSDPGLGGMTLYAQMLVFDSTHNAMGIRFSPGGQMKIGTPPPPMPVMHLYSYDTSSTPSVDDTVKYTGGYGIIMKLN